jgi:hypothetical protein
MIALLYSPGLQGFIEGYRDRCSRCVSIFIKVYNNLIHRHLKSVGSSLYDSEICLMGNKEREPGRIDAILFKCLHRQHRVGTVNWQPGSNYTIVIHAGNGMAALALWGEKGDAPPEPAPLRAEAPRIAICVLVENGGFGATAASPIARAVMDAYLLEEPAAASAPTEPKKAAGPP